MPGESKRSFSLFLPRPPAAPEMDWQPPIDIYVTAYGWLVKCDLAGVRPQDLRLSLSGRFLTVIGERRDHCMEEGCRHHRMEITYSRFERRVELPADVTGAGVTSEYQDGMLLVRITREAKP